MESQSPKALGRSLRTSVRRPSVSMLLCKSIRPSDSVASSGSCQGSPVGLTSRARPVSGSARAATWVATRGSIQAAPACTYFGWAVSRCTSSKPASAVTAASSSRAGQGRSGLT